MKLRKLLAIAAVIGACSVNQASAWSYLTSWWNGGSTPASSASVVGQEFTTGAIQVPTSAIHYHDTEQLGGPTLSSTPVVVRDKKYGYWDGGLGGIMDRCCPDYLALLPVLAMTGLSVAECILSAQLSYFSAKDPSNSYPNMLHSLIGVYATNLVMKSLGLACSLYGASSSFGAGLLAFGCGALLAAPEIAFLILANNALNQGATLTGQMGWLISSSVVSFVLGCVIPKYAHISHNTKITYIKRLWDEKGTDLSISLAETIEKSKDICLWGASGSCKIIHQTIPSQF